MADVFEVRLSRVAGYEFQVDFGAEGIPALVVDEPPPLGANAGPNPARLLATAVADCLSASLIFCLGRSRVQVAGVDTRVVGTLRRNERGRLRIGRLEVSIRIDVPGAEPARLGRCLETFEDFCVVTASIRTGIEVDLTVVDADGRRLLERPAHPVG
jgi:organic hydroperoxide reductase OsmC/OhrA